MTSRRGAGLIIIGDELLKGRVQDANSVYLTQELWRLGIRTKKIVVIPDDVTEIARYVHEFSKEFQFVISTGGVGPTHDDVTFEGVARGMGRELQTDSDVTDYLRRIGFGEKAVRESTMSRIPQGSEVYFGADNTLWRWFPLIKLCNVFVLPGIPSYVRTIFRECRGYFEGADQKFYSKEIYFKIDESVFAKGLGDIQQKYRKLVEIGSYPVIEESYKTKITIDSVDESAVQNCFQEVKRTLFPEYQTEICENSSEVQRKGTGSEDLRVRLEESVSVLEKTFVMYSYGEICVAFNGGKDCTVLLQLVKRVLRHPRRGLENLTKIPLLYIKNGDAFPEMEQFLERTSGENNQKVVRVEGGMKEALGEFRKMHPSVKAILMGTRGVDPNSEQLHFFQTTDSDWPHFMRVMPILSWSYEDVWKFIWEDSVPYCTLYDQGYTSIGDVNSTVRNPALRVPGSKDEYRPAYLLEDLEKEREGRK